MRSNNKRKKSRPRWLGVFFGLCLFRTLNAWFIATQFDPDEYWQTLEPAYCKAFGKCGAQTWEWTRRGSKLWDGPVRSYLNVLPIFWYYKTLPSASHSWWFSKGPALVHAVSVAAPTDFAIYILSQRFSLGIWPLICSLTNWFHGYALVRTYSNSVETMLLALGLVLVLHRPNLAFVLSGCSVAIRFTALAAWIPMGLFLLLEQPSWKISAVVAMKAIMAFLAGISISVVVDRVMYGFWTLPILSNLWFNVILGKGALYGTHAWHWYLTAGLPAICGILFPILIKDMLLPLPAWKMKYYAVLACYITLHSISAHKEFRFLMPVLPLVCLFVGHRIDTWVSGRSRRAWVVGTILILTNGPLFVYLARFHQRAPIAVQEYLAGDILQKDNVTIHYLMGCHSTPLYSHLHTPSTTVEAWTLDCSPTCRASTTELCESELFLTDPIAFFVEHYGERTECQLSEVCLHKKKIPDYIIINSEQAAQLDELLRQNKLYPKTKLVNGIVGVRISNVARLGNGWKDKTIYGECSLGPLRFATDDMTVYAQMQ